MWVVPKHAPTTSAVVCMCREAVSVENFSPMADQVRGTSSQLY